MAHQYMPKIFHKVFLMCERNQEDLLVEQTFDEFLKVGECYIR